MKRVRRSFKFRRFALVTISGLLAVSSILSLFPTAPADAVTFPVHQPDRKIGAAVTLDGPQGIAQDSAGNYFIRDQRAHIKKVSPTGEFILQFGCRGTGNGCFYSLSNNGGIAVDSQDNVWVVDSQYHRVQKFDNNGNFLLMIGSPTGVSGTTDGLFKTPSRIAVDSANNVYVTDTMNHRIQKFNSSGVFQWKIGGLVLGAGDGQFNEPRQIAINSSDVIYVGDTKNGRIQKFTTAGTFISKFGSAVGGLYCAPDPSFSNIIGMAFDSLDNLYVSSYGGLLSCPDVYKYDTADAYTGRLAIEDMLYDISINAAGNVMGIVSLQNLIYGINEYQMDGTFIRRMGDGTTPGDFRDSAAMTEDPAGNLYVIDSGNARIQKFNAAGQHLLTFGVRGTGLGQINQPTDIAIDSAGNILVSDGSQARVTKYDATGTYVSSFDKKGTGVGLFTNGIGSIALDSSDNIYAINTLTANVVEKFSADGTHLQTIGTSGTGVGFTSGIADVEIGPDGQLYILNTGSSSSKRVSIFTTAGVYQREFRAFVYPPWGGSQVKGGYDELELDSQGNVYTGRSDTGQTGIVVQSNTGELLNTIGNDYTAYSNSGGWTSRSFYLFVSRIDDELFVNGDYDHVLVYSVSDYVQPPSAPTSVAIAQSGSGNIHVSWEPPLDNGGIDPYAYTVEYRLHGSAEWIRHYVDWNYLYPPATRSADIGVPTGNYDVRVRAVNAAGAGLIHQQDNIAVTATLSLDSHVTLPANAGFRGVAYDSNGEMYVINEYVPNIQHYNPTTGVFTTIYGSYGTGVGQLRDPQHMIIGPDDRLYIADSGNDRIHIIETDGTLVRTFGSAGTVTDGQFGYLTRMAFDNEDNLYVADYYRVQKFDKDGNFIQQFASELTDPTSVAVDSQGNIYVTNDNSDPAQFGIHKYDASGNKLLRFGVEGDAVGQMYASYYTVIDGSDNIIYGDVWNGKVHTFSSDGTLIDWFGRSSMAGDSLTEWPLATFEEMSAFELTPSGGIIISESYWADFPGYTILSSNSAPVANTRPSAPRSLSASPSNGGSIMIEWQAPASAGSSAVTKYKIEHKPTTASTWVVQETTAPVLVYTLSDLVTGTYDVRVSASNGSGYGTPTSIQVTVIGSTINPQPTAPGVASPGSNNTGSRAPATAALQPSTDVLPQADTPMTTTAPTTSMPLVPVQDNEQLAVATDTEQNNTPIALIATVCTALVTSAGMLWIFVAWKRRRKRGNQQNSNQGFNQQ